MKIIDYLSLSNLAVNDENLTIKDISLFFIEKDLESVVLVKNKKPITIVTNTDILNFLLSNKQDLKIKDVKHKKIVTINANSDIYTAYQVMRNNNISHLIVVNDKNEYLGVISQKDMIFKLVETTLKDELTGLFNRRYFEVIIDKYSKLSVPIGIIFIDIDKFKEINDTFGHQKGDEIIQRVARNISKSIRSTDFAFRYGGDEFVVIVVNQEKEIIKKIANRIFENIKKDNISVSMGVGFYPDDNKCLHEVIKIADKKLYKAKEKRGRIIF